MISITFKNPIMNNEKNMEITYYDKNISYIHIYRRYLCYLEINLFIP